MTNIMRNNLATQKRVLITGASSGIGAAMAIYLADRDFLVWGTTRSLDKVATLPEELQRKIHFLSLDVTDDQSVEAGVKEFIEQAGRVDVLINNAGYGTFGALEEYPIAGAREIFETNYFGTLRMIQKVLPYMRQSRAGLIINLSSLGANLVIPFQVHYSATKAAIDVLTEGLRQEVRPFGIRVVAVAPGDIKTNFNQMIDFGMREDSPYQKWANACWQMTDENMQKAPPPELIAKKVFQVIQKKRPRTIYPAGDFLSSKFPLISRFVPRRVKEKLIRKFYGVDFK